MSNKITSYRTVWTNPVHFLAFGFGSGVVPVAPGTWGTVVAIPFYLVMQQTLAWPYYLAVLALLTVFGFWLCHVTAKAFGIHDHPGIVWDEICGYLLAMFLAPAGWQWIAIGFLLFRLFDIWKPFPIRWLDQKVRGGVGIMLDDLVAGLYAWLVIQALVRFTPIVDFI